MSRRDTIIIAALINAGLLIILFVSALKTSGSPEELSMKQEEPVVSDQALAVKNEAKMIMGDEVDRVLKQYSQSNPLQEVAAVQNTATETQPVSPVTEIAPIVPAPAHFIDDLQAIAQSPEPTPVPTPAVEEGPSFMEVKVKKGDVLEKIARHHHTSVSEIMKLNHLKSTQLKIGQVLKVPSGTKGKSAEKKVEVVSDSSSAPQYYTVKAGDNPWTIAVKNHMKVEDLLKLNQIDEAKARKLKPGDQIRIR